MNFKVYFPKKKKLFDYTITENFVFCLKANEHWLWGISFCTWRHLQFTWNLSLKIFVDQMGEKLNGTSKEALGKEYFRLFQHLKYILLLNPTHSLYFSWKKRWVYTATCRKMKMKLHITFKQVTGYFLSFGIKKTFYENEVPLLSLKPCLMISPRLMLLTETQCVVGHLSSSSELSSIWPARTCFLRTCPYSNFLGLLSKFHSPQRLMTTPSWECESHVLKL